jgi:SHS2 domain-containing protein
MPRVFEILQHTADVRLRVTGKSLEELFAESVRALLAAMKAAPAGEGEPFAEGIVVDAPDVTALLVDFLGEVLLRTHIRQRMFDRIAIGSLTETRVEATISGPPATFEEDVKAVTYHEADVQHAPDGTWSTTLVLDI